LRESSSRGRSWESLDRAQVEEDIEFTREFRGVGGVRRKSKLCETLLDGSYAVGKTRIKQYQTQHYPHFSSGYYDTSDSLQGS